MNVVRLCSVWAAPWKRLSRANGRLLAPNKKHPPVSSGGCFCETLTVWLLMLMLLFVKLGFRMAHHIFARLLLGKLG